MPALFCADRNHDPGRFPGFENRYHLIALGLLEAGAGGVLVTITSRPTTRSPLVLTTSCLTSVVVVVTTGSVSQPANISGASPIR